MFDLKTAGTSKGVDFTQELLNCLIHGQTHRQLEEASDHSPGPELCGDGLNRAAKSLYEKLMLAINGNRADVLSKTLEESRTSMGIDARQAAINEALHQSILQDKVECTRQLIDRGADLNQYNMPKLDDEMSMDDLVSLNHNPDNKEAVSRIQASRKWSKLIGSRKNDHRCRHVIHFFGSTQDNRLEKYSKRRTVPKRTGSFRLSKLQKDLNTPTSTSFHKKGLVQSSIPNFKVPIPLKSPMSY